MALEQKFLIASLGHDLVPRTAVTKQTALIVTATALRVLELRGAHIQLFRRLRVSGGLQQNAAQNCCSEEEFEPGRRYEGRGMVEVCEHILGGGRHGTYIPTPR